MCVCVCLCLMNCPAPGLGVSKVKTPRLSCTHWDEMRFNINSIESQFFSPTVRHCSRTRTYATRLCRIQIRRENKFWFAYKYELERTSYIFTTTSGHSSSNFTHFFCSLFISYFFSLDALVLCPHSYSPRREGRVAFSTFIFFFSSFFNSLPSTKSCLPILFFTFSALTRKLNWICWHNRTFSCIVFRGYITPSRYTAIRLGISHRFLSMSVIVRPQQFVFMCAARYGMNTYDVAWMGNLSFCLRRYDSFWLCTLFPDFFFVRRYSRPNSFEWCKHKRHHLCPKMWHVMGRTRNIFVGIW